MKSQSASISDRFEKLPRALRDLDSDLGAIVVLLAGDLVWSGKKEEFECFTADFEPMLRSIRELLQSVPLYVVGVPGNHDCDFTHPMVTLRSRVLRDLARSSIDADQATLDVCCSVQEHFFAFLKHYEAPKPSSHMACAAYDYEIPLGDEYIAIRCFNTALSSTNPETPGQLIYPLNLLKSSESTSSAAYWVALFHHPYGWLAPTIKRQFTERVEDSCDLILTGHEHITAYYKKEAYSGLASNYIEGAAFFSQSSGEKNGFNAVIVDLSANAERLFQFTWNKDHFTVTDVSNGWRPYRRSRIRRDFEPTDKMFEYLQDPGAHLAHPAKPRLLLEDIFVPPNAEELRLDKPEAVLDGKTAVDSKDLLAHLSNSRRVAVMGPERCGKTTLAKVLFRQMYSKGHVPILINGSEIRSAQIEKFNRVIETAISQDYKNASIDKFRQLEDDRITIIIDDFDHAKLNVSGKLRLLQSVTERFRHVVVFADDIMWFEDLTSGDVSTKIFTDFKHIKIAEFGYVLRSAIIDKWYDVNREFVLNPEQLTFKVATVERYIDDFLSKSYLPSVPIFILMLIQSFDASQPLESSGASYGYLYSILVTRQLAGGKQKLSLDKKLAYLIELAFHMHCNHRKELTAAEFDKFHQAHSRQYVRIDQDLIKKELEEAGILELYHDMYRFRYNYFYYYFVAEYFNRHIAESRVKKLVTHLCEHLEDDDNANIILFLTHQSRATFVLDTIVAHAKTIFGKIKAPRFDKDVQFLSNLYEKVPQLVYVNKTTAEMRNERRLALDKERANVSRSPKRQRDMDEVLQVVRDLRAAFRSLEVMGQIVKNYAGSLTIQPKCELVTECYETGLRVVGVILKVWQILGERFVREVLDVILEERPQVESKNDLERLLKQFLFLNCEMVAFEMIKKTSHAVGAKDLGDVYDLVLSKNPTNAYRLIDYSIKADSAGFPMAETLTLSSEVRNSVFCTRLLGRLAMYHFYLFHTSEQTKQKVCEKLGIELKNLRGAGLRTDRRKRLPGRK